jgi:Fe-S-cluster-containing dehydrogenase component
MDDERKVMSKCTLCVDRIHDQDLPVAERKPACVLACPPNARLFGDVHDPDSEVSVAIRERGGYALMPEWNTRPANHYLPRRRTDLKVHAEDLVRVDNPLKIDGKQPETPYQGGGREDYAT